MRLKKRKHRITLGVSRELFGVLFSVYLKIAYLDFLAHGGEALGELIDKAHFYIEIYRAVY